MFHVVKMPMKRFNYSIRLYCKTPCVVCTYFDHYINIVQWGLPLNFNMMSHFFCGFFYIFNNEISHRKMVRRLMINEFGGIWKESVMRKTSKNLGVTAGPAAIRNEHLPNECLGSYLTSSPAYSANRCYSTFLLLFIISHLSFFNH
jgi:hypothetical protein